MLVTRIDRDLRSISNIASIGRKPALIFFPPSGWTGGVYPGTKGRKFVTSWGERAEQHRRDISITKTAAFGGSNREDATRICMGPKGAIGTRQPSFGIFIRSPELPFPRVQVLDQFIEWRWRGLWRWRKLKLRWLLAGIFAKEADVQFLER